MRAFFNMNSYHSGPQPFNKDVHEDKHIDMRTIGLISNELVTGKIQRTLYLQWYTVVACSIVFFFCFATGEHAERLLGNRLS